MARHKHRSKATADRRRDAHTIANTPVVDLDDLVRFSPLVRSQPDPKVEDHRLWTPDPDSRRPRLVSGRVARVHLPKAKRPLTSSVSGRRFFNDVQALHFKAPKYVQICVRRKQRREVLLAKGRGGGKHRPPKRNRFSDIRC